MTMPHPTPEPSLRLIRDQELLIAHTCFVVGVRKGLAVEEAERADVSAIARRIRRRVVGNRRSLTRDDCFQIWEATVRWCHSLLNPQGDPYA